MNSAASTADIKSSDFSGGPQKNQVVGFFFQLFKRQTRQGLLLFPCLPFTFLTMLRLWLAQGRIHSSPLPAQKPKSLRAKHPANMLQQWCSLLQSGKYQELQEA